MAAGPVIVLLSWYGVEREGDEEVDADEERESVIGDDEAEEKEEYSEEEDMGEWMLEDEVVPLTRERREELLIVLDELPGSVYDELMKENDKDQWEVGEGWLKRARTASIGYSKLEHKQGRTTTWRHEEERKKRAQNCMKLDDFGFTIQSFAPSLPSPTPSLSLPNSLNDNFVDLSDEDNEYEIDCQHLPVSSSPNSPSACTHLHSALAPLSCSTLTQSTIVDGKHSRTKDDEDLTPPCYRGHRFNKRTKEESAKWKEQEIVRLAPTHN
ncbi:hypothetical protein BT69DRAFT_1328731 [Atractiella rhizophila]|nr:hypothetical protein BT69DRAFT_1328731 [Atractiella rhizophila]